MRPLKKLTNRIVEVAELGRHSDGGGLYLDVKSQQSRFWSYRYTIGGKTREMGLGPAGSAPGAILLSEARKKVAKLQQMVNSGVDPLGEHTNLYQEYLAQRHALTEKKRQWLASVVSREISPSPDERASKDAELSGDLSVMDELARSRVAPEGPPGWVTRLAYFRMQGLPIFALFAIAFWPDKPLAPELRWFLQRALMPLIEAAHENDGPEVEATHKQVLLNLGLLARTKGGRPDLSVYRRMMKASDAAHRMEEAHAAAAPKTLATKAALEDVARDMGISRTTLDELLGVAEAIAESEKHIKELWSGT